MTTQNKIDNAIKWIKGLSNTKLPQGTGELGDNKSGFCCLGYGCYLLDIPYKFNDEFSEELAESIGLLQEEGWIEGPAIEGCVTLAELNDDVNYSFRRIATVLKDRPEDIFEPEVAKGIKEYFKK